MTYVEFFERTDTENICAALTGSPDRVVFVGKDRRVMEKSVARYKKILADRGCNTEFVVKTADPSHLGETVKALEDIVREYGRCLFDLTGGQDLYLVAAGMVYERNPEKIELVRFDVSGDRAIDCDGNDYPKFAPFPKLSVKENVSLYGGRVIYGDGATYKWKITDELLRDIDALWNICKRDVKRWNKLSGLFEAADKISGEGAKLVSDANISLLSTYTETLVTKSNFDTETLELLREGGLISSWEFNGNKFRVSYKNEAIKKCLTKAGQVLEMKVFTSALKTVEKDGTPTFGDVETGVCIDWDGETKGFDTENEIDVMMMHGMIPVFVSCKNGFVEIDELYKLNTVARRFGAEYAEKVLVASSLDLDSSFGKILGQRADEMGIKILASEIVGMSNGEICKKLRSFCK